MPGPLTGLIPATHTPFLADGRLNVEAVDRQAELLRESGIEAVFIAGTTGECASLSVAERKALAERWVKVGGETIRVAVHVGSNCQGDAVELAAHARGTGAAAVAVMAPHYFKPASVEDLIAYCVPIAAEADPLPFYFYDIPGMTGVRLSMPAFLLEAKTRIPTLRGLKYSNTDLVQLQECIRLEGGAFDMLFGCDECLLAGLSLGVRGEVGSTYNFAAPLYQRIQAAFERGDLEAARADQARAVALVRALEDFGFLPASKVLMEWLGVDCGPARPPLRNLSKSDREALWERLAAFDVFPRKLRRSS